MTGFLRLPLIVAGTMIALFLVAGPASAQNTRSYVSGVGNDADPCSRTAPCMTFAGAFVRTATDGEINCVDPGDFGPVTITRSITIDCHDAVAAIQNPSSNAITVAFDSFPGSDTRKTVNLRNLTINGVSSGLVGINISGAGAGSFVNIEDCLINGNFGAPATGILDERTRGAMTITDTKVRNMGTAGISIASPADGSRRAIITRTRVYNSGNGIVVGADANVELSRSVVSNNVGAGVMVASTGLLGVDSTVISHNGTAFQISGTGTLYLSNSDIFLNSVGSIGTINSFTNNRFINNGTFAAIMPIGSTSIPTGQQ
jgi:parallel beta helix pectate lyase-like protein